MDRGKASNLQGLKGQPILYVPEPRLLIAQKYRPLNEQGPEILTDPVPKEQSETLFQGVLTHNVNRADQQGVHMSNSTVNDARVRQEITGLEITNNLAVAAPALADEAGVLVAVEVEVVVAEADEDKRKK